MSVYFITAREVGRVKIGCGELGLNVDGLPPIAWRAALFRKIRPDKHEPCEEEFVALLNKHRSKVPA